MRPKSPKELHWRSVARGRLLLAITTGMTVTASRTVPRALDPDPLTIVGRSISVRVPRQKGCDGGHAAPSAHVAHGTKAGPLASIPPIRGGVPAGTTPSYIVKANGVAAPLGAARAISYGCERETRSYWPDYPGKRHAARTFVAEAGLAEAEDKGTGDACILARTARRLAHLQSGHVWTGRATVLLDLHVWSLMALQLQGRLFATFHAIEPDIVRVWQSDGLASIYDVLCQCGRFGRRCFDLEVEPATWMTAADAAAEGLLLVDRPHRGLAPDELGTLRDAEAGPYPPPLLPESRDWMMMTRRLVPKRTMPETIRLYCAAGYSRRPRPLRCEPIKEVSVVDL